MSHFEPDTDPQSIPPASPEMAGKLAVNRAGRLTSSQRRLMVMGAGAAGLFLLCPLMLVIQLGWVALAGQLPPATWISVAFLVVGLLFILVLLGLIGTNLQMFVPDAVGQHPVRFARGLLRIHMSAKERLELPFSYVIEDYSFAPFMAPGDVLLRTGAPYIVYYAAHSRVLLSLAALDAPDAAQWEPAFDGEPGQGDDFPPPAAPAAGNP